MYKKQQINRQRMENLIEKIQKEKIYQFDEIVEFFGLNIHNFLFQINAQKAKLISIKNVMQLFRMQQCDGIEFKQELSPVEETGQTEFKIPRGFDIYNYVRIYNIPLTKIYKIEWVIGDKVREVKISNKIYFSSLIGTPADLFQNQAVKLRVIYDPQFRDFVKLDVSCMIIDPVLYDVYLKFPEMKNITI